MPVPLYGLCGARNLLTPLSGIENALSEIEQGKQIHPSILSFVFIFFSIFRPDATRAGERTVRIRKVKGSNPSVSTINLGILVISRFFLLCAINRAIKLRVLFVRGQKKQSRPCFSFRILVLWYGTEFFPRGGAASCWILPVA